HQIAGVTYYNCGDWVESCTAMVEQRDGRIELVSYPPFPAPRSAKIAVPEEVLIRRSGGRMLPSDNSARGFHDMKTRDFIAALRQSHDKPLLFANAAGDGVHRGYHLTEIKAAIFDTVDCGGRVNRWPEAIFQLWVPENADDRDMKADKFVRIYEKVRGLIPLDENAEVRIKYGDENFFPSLYRVVSISTDKSALRVLLQPPATTCKARDRAIDSSVGSCCV